MAAVGGSQVGLHPALIAWEHGNGAAAGGVGQRDLAAAFICALYALTRAKVAGSLMSATE